MVTVIFLNQRSMLSEGGNPFCVAGKDFRTANIKLHRDKLLKALLQIVGGDKLIIPFC